MVSRTQKDSGKNKDTVLEAVMVADNDFDIFLNHKLYRSHTQEDALEDFFCRRYGFCQDEFDEILNELKQTGRKIITL